MTNKLDEIKARLEKLDKEAKEKKARIEAEAKDKSEKLKNQLKRMEQTQKAKDRKRDSRRKIVAGAFTLDWLEKNSDVASRWWADIDKTLTRNIDRELFDWPGENKQQ